MDKLSKCMGTFTVTIENPVRFASIKNRFEIWKVKFMCKVYDHCGKS